MFGDDEATKRAIAASLRDQEDQEERARRQQPGQPGAPVRELLGANGTPSALRGGTIGYVALPELLSKDGMSVTMFRSCFLESRCACMGGAAWCKACHSSLCPL